MAKRTKFQGLTRVTPAPDLGGGVPWAPSRDGAHVEGVFRGIGRRTGVHGVFDVVVIDTDTGRVVAGGRRLLDLVRQTRLPPGERIGIVFTGWDDDDARRFEVHVPTRFASNG